MLVGYMRVSSADERQSVDLQRDALVAAGVDERHLHQDKASGARDDRPGLKTCLEDLRSGDVLVVWKLDRLGRSLSHLLKIVETLKARGVAFRSLTEQMDTTTPHGEFLFNIFGSLAQYERALIRERVTAGLAGEDRADHRRPGRWGQQGIGLPDLWRAALDADRHA
jgi:DNA invertase Pin-like site-specific DNA recombinase